MICRICLLSTEQFQSLIHDRKARKALTDLCGILVKTNDNLPQSICTKCLKLLYEFYEFRKMILNNNKILLESCEENALVKEGTKQIPTVKEEQKVIYSKPVTEPDIVSSEDENLLTIKSIIATKVKKMEHKRIKKAEVSKKTSRVLIKLDPKKITVISLSKEEQMKQHRTRAQRPEYYNMPFRCDRCYKGFNYERKLNSHVEKYHKENSDFKCDVCSKTMVNSASLALHVKTHELLYQCNLCKDSFAEKSRAVSHYKSAHEGKNTEYPCKLCNKILNYCTDCAQSFECADWQNCSTWNRSSLYGHMRNHHPREEQPECKICNKKFVSKDSLDDHMLIHTGEKNYRCDVCDARFRLRQSARAHAACHTRAFVRYCVPCDATFKSTPAYKHHLATAKAHVKQDVMAKNTCSTCGRQFSTKYALRKHSVTHNSNRTRATVAPQKVLRCVCHYCGRGFSTRRILDNHILVHTGARPHACVHCGATFTQLATLRTHMRRKHVKSINTDLQSDMLKVTSTKVMEKCAP